MCRLSLLWISLCGSLLWVSFHKSWVSFVDFFFLSLFCRFLFCQSLLMSRPSLSWVSVRGSPLWVSFVVLFWNVVCPFCKLLCCESLLWFFLCVSFLTCASLF